MPISAKCFMRRRVRSISCCQRARAPGESPGISVAMVNSSSFMPPPWARPSPPSTGHHQAWYRTMTLCDNSIARRSERYSQDPVCRQLRGPARPDPEVLLQDQAVVVAGRAAGPLEPRRSACHAPSRHLEEQLAVDGVGEALQAPALPPMRLREGAGRGVHGPEDDDAGPRVRQHLVQDLGRGVVDGPRSEENTSELESQSNFV